MGPEVLEDVGEVVPHLVQHAGEHLVEVAAHVADDPPRTRADRLEVLPQARRGRAGRQDVVEGRGDLRLGVDHDPVDVGPEAFRLPRISRTSPVDVLDHLDASAVEALDRWPRRRHRPRWRRCDGRVLASVVAQALLDAASTFPWMPARSITVDLRAQVGDQPRARRRWPTRFAVVRERCPPCRRAPGSSAGCRRCRPRRSRRIGASTVSAGARSSRERPGSSASSRAPVRFTEICPRSCPAGSPASRRACATTAVTNTSRATPSSPSSRIRARSSFVSAASSRRRRARRAPRSPGRRP